ncbi:MAG: transglycosylase SLT domain-containing protein [Gammaproteobacteria bacterium]|nr:transglycosylase SLT domain-containing protein [Gammaproteobacteria bacterium]
MPVKKLHQIISVVFLLLFAAGATSPVIAETVRVPIKLDYPVLQQLMLSQLFNTPDKRVEILNDATGCSTIFLSDPELGEYQQKLEITAYVEARIATAVFGNCTHLFNWEGDARFLTEPVILPGARSVRLNILKTQLYNPQGELITGQMWDLASGPLQPLMSRYEIDLSPTINQLNALLPDILSQRSVEQINKITDSLRLDAIAVTADGIDVAVKFQIDRLPVTPEPAAVLSADELNQLEARWQMMDAMVTFAVKRYAKVTQQQELRDTLAEILLDARYRLRDALVMPVTQANDPVRDWFIDSWQRMGPVLRQISLENPGQEPMLLISLLTATDALETLDRLGPAIGLDISANGLRRMGRMLIDQPGVNPLHYDDAVDPELRGLFQLPAVPVANQPAGFKFDLWPIRSAWAKSTNDRLKLWVPKKNELPEYLPIIRDLLNDSASSTIEKTQLDASVKRIFENLVLTTAWQESCWRQYEVKNNKIVTLRSSSGDAGLMQMNERVWRGLYDTQKLRWDIAYNAQAGVEVLQQYLVKYAMKRGEQRHPGGLDNLARSAYSAYNGGPSKTSRYRNPKAPSAHKKIDAAFWKKYQAVKQGKELQVAECLGGDVSAIVNSSSNKPAAKKVHSEPDKRGAAGANSGSADQAWILAQNQHHYTLQLATFSSYKAARRFTADTRLTGTVAIAPLVKGNQTHYVVLNDSFANKAEADKRKQQSRKLKPWVRQFKDIHTSMKR